MQVQPHSTSNQTNKELPLNNSPTAKKLGALGDGLNFIVDEKLFNEIGTSWNITYEWTKTELQEYKEKIEKNQDVYFEKYNELQKILSEIRIELDQNSGSAKLASELENLAIELNTKYKEKALI